MQKNGEEFPVAFLLRGQCSEFLAEESHFLQDHTKRFTMNLRCVIAFETVHHGASKYYHVNTPIYLNAQNKQKLVEPQWRTDSHAEHPH